MELFVIFSVIILFILIGDLIAYKFYPKGRIKNMKSNAVIVILLQISILSFVYIVVS